MPSYLRVIEVPVYRHSRVVHDQKEREKWQKMIDDNSFSQTGDRQWLDRHWEIWLQSSTPWKYNTICGWIEVFVHGSRVKGEYWARTSRATTRRPCFDHHGRVFEFVPSGKCDDQQIGAMIIENIKDASSRKPLKGRYCDCGCLDNIAPLVKWRLLLGIDG